LGHLDERLLHPVALDALAVGHGGAEHLLVPADHRVQVVHGDADVVELGQLPAGAGVGAHAPWRRNRAMRSSPTLALSSGSSTPRPSRGARHSTPILPSCRLWWTWLAASPVCSKG